MSNGPDALPIITSEFSLSATCKLQNPMISFSFPATLNIVILPGSAAVDEFKYSDESLWKRAWEERIRDNIDKYPSTQDYDDLIGYTIHNDGNTLYIAFPSGE